MNCSATLAALALLLASVSAGGATSATFDDAVARMQYAVYTADAPSLRHRLEELRALPPAARSPALRAYQLAYGYWQLAVLEAADAGGVLDVRMQARRTARQCADQARQALQLDSALAEAQALKALCDSFAVRHPGGGSSECARSRVLAQALQQAPTNPRVSFIAALCRSTLGEADSDEAWLAVVARFEAAPGNLPGEADWGHAEALTMLGERFLQQGQVVAARDALERALVVAPGYLKAQRLLQSATAAG